MTAARPTLGRPPAFALPPTERLRLDNGLQATLVAVGSVPKVELRLVLDVGDINEAPGETWLSRLAAEYLKEGTSARSAEALADAAADLGGELEVDSDDDTTVVRIRVLSEHASAAVALLAEVARESTFPEAAEARLKADLERRLALARVRPQMLALAEFRAALYGDHPYGRVFPADGVIASFTAAAARDFYRRNTGGATAALYVAGRFDAAVVSGAIRDAFAGWDAGAARTDRPPHPRSGRVVRLVDRPGAEQTTLFVGLPVPSPLHADWVPLAVTNALLGGAFYSRITMNLREDKGYTYSPHSYLSLRRRDAHWMEIADVTTNVTGASLQEVFAEIERLRGTAPGAEELESIQRYVAGTYMMHYATPSGVAEQLAFLELHGLPESFAEGYVDRAYAVTPDEVRRVTAAYLRGDEMTIVAVGDAAVIRDQLAPYQ